MPFAQAPGRRERQFVHRLEESRTKNPMNLDSGIGTSSLSIGSPAGFRELPGGSGVLALHPLASDVIPASCT